VKTHVVSNVAMIAGTITFLRIPITMSSDATPAM
jgi:hypothetical protein